MIRRLNIVLLVLLCACHKADPNTQIVISVDTNFAIPTELDVINIKIEQRSDRAFDVVRHDRDEQLVGKTDRDFPLTLAMTSVNSGKPTVRVTVTGLLDENLVVTRQAIVSFRSGQTLSLPMNLVTACKDKLCNEGFTCGDDGLCEAIVRDDLDAWQGEPPGLDGSTSMPPREGGVPLPDASRLDDAGSESGVGPDADADSGPDPDPDAGAPSEPRIRQLAVGFYHSCALLVNGRVACWGGNSSRELGVDTEPSDCPGQTFPCSVNPRLVAGVEGAVEIGAGERFACALAGTGEVYCWGSNSQGQLGIADNAGSSAAQRVRFRAAVAEPSVILTGVDKLAVGRSHACARVASTHGLVCWGGGDNEKSEIPLAGSLGSNVAVPMDISAGVEQLAIGHAHGCFIDPDSALWCWGWNQSGQVGLDPAAVPSTVTPSRVIASGVTDVAAGGAHTCALVNGALECFGSAFAGQLGLGPVPVGFPDCLYGACTPKAYAVQEVGSPAQQLALADFSSCARYANGRVACWGSGYLSAIGQPNGMSAFTPIYLASDPRGVRLVAGFSGHFCLSVETRPSEVLCWGANPEGQLGPNASIGTPQSDLATVTLDPSFFGP